MHKKKWVTGIFVGLFGIASVFSPVAALAQQTPELTVPTISGEATVERAGGIDQYETAALIAQKGWPETSDAVIVAAGMKHNLIDALAAGPLASLVNAPILLTDGSNTLNSFAKTEIERLKPKTIYVTSGTAVIKPAVLEELQNMPGVENVQSLGGIDQYETSVKIAKEMAKQGADISKVVVAAGYLPPADALSVASIAGIEKMPILTTVKNQLPATVKTYVDSLSGVTNSYVIGGTAVIADSVKSELPGQVDRVFGDTKFDTNQSVIANFSTSLDGDNIYVANGDTLIDALSGTPLAAKNRSPIVLTNSYVAANTIEYVKTNIFPCAKVVALGGEVVVPQTEVDAMASSVTLSDNDAVVGSEDAAQSQDMKDNLQILADNVTLQNADVPYNVYIQGDNAVLNNVKVTGTVIVNPGTDGVVNLDGVSAGSVVVLSGATNSVHLKDVTADNLLVASNNEVRVEISGNTQVNTTFVSSKAILDAVAGSFGNVFVSKVFNVEPALQLNGSFDKPVFVSSQATISAAADAVVPSVEIVPLTENQKITLQGKFGNVDLIKEALVDVAANSQIDSIVAYSNASLSVDKTAVVSSIDKQDNDVTVINLFTGDQAKANVVPENFNTNMSDAYIGYNVGWHLTDSLPLSDVAKMEVSLYDSEGNLLVTNTSTDKILTLDSTEFSTPFDLTGKYSDEYWTMGTWTHKVQPAKAVIKLTDTNGDTYTVENNNLVIAAGDEKVANYLDTYQKVNLTGDDANAYVAAENFNTNMSDAYIGYNVGWHLTDSLPLSDVAKMEVSLYDAEGNLLVTNTSTDKILTLNTAEFSTPFDLTDNYTDEYWTMGTWSKKVEPVKAVIKITSKYGDTYTVENDSLAVVAGDEGISSYLDSTDTTN